LCEHSDEAHAELRYFYQPVHGTMATLTIGLHRNA